MIQKTISLLEKINDYEYLRENDVQFRTFGNEGIYGIYVSISPKSLTYAISIEFTKDKAGYLLSVKAGYSSVRNHWISVNEKDASLIKFISLEIEEKILQVTEDQLNNYLSTFK